MKYLFNIVPLLFIVGCTVYDKNNVYQPKPTTVYTIPNVTCDGAYFCKVFSSDSKVIRLSDSTFGIERLGAFQIFNDKGIQIDSVNISALTSGSTNASKIIVPLWDESGFFLYTPNKIYAFSSSVQPLWNSNPSLAYDYPDKNLISGPDNSLIIEAGNVIYSIKPGKVAQVIADLSYTVTDILSITCFPDGRIVAYALKKDYPKPYNDLYGMFEILPNGSFKEISRWSYSTNKNFKAYLNRQKNGNISLLRYEENDVYHPSSRLYSIDPSYDELEEWSAYDLKDNSFYSQNTSPSIKFDYIGSGYSMVYLDFYYSPGYLFDSSGTTNTIKKFQSQSSDPSQVSFDNRSVQPSSINAMRNQKLLVSELQYKISNNTENCCPMYLAVFLTDLNGDFCK